MKSMRDTRAIPQKQSVQTQKRKRSRWTRDDTELSILALPTTVWYALFCYLPMFGLVLAFKNYKISAGKSFVYSLFHSEWAGLDNFSFFLKSNQFATILRNTLLYNIVFIILGIVLPVGLAIMINNIYSKRKSKTYQTMMFLPHFMCRHQLLRVCVPEPGPGPHELHPPGDGQGPCALVFRSEILAIHIGLYAGLEDPGIQHGCVPCQYHRH